jgi:hypothetical protein
MTDKLVFTMRSHFRDACPLEKLIIVAFLSACIPIVDSNDTDAITNELACSEAAGYIGVHKQEFPQQRFSVVRFIQNGQPVTQDFILGRTNVFYDESGNIINTTCD